MPTNPLSLDRYAYSLNNPTRYVDPSGHNPIVLALVAIGPVGWVALGVLTVGTVVYFASGGPEAFAEGLTPAMESLSDAVSQTRTDPKPWGLTTEQQKQLWGEAIEALKEGLDLPNGYTVSKDIMQKVTDMILAGVTSAEAIADALADEIQGEDDD